MQRGIWINDYTKSKIYPYLNKDMECDAVIIGGGISGAITAFFLAKEGFNIVVLEKNIIGHENTSLSAATLTDFVDELYYKNNKDINKINYFNNRANSLLDEILVDIGKDNYFNKINYDILTTKMFQKGIFKGEADIRNNMDQKAKLLEKGKGIEIEKYARTINSYELTCDIFKYISDFSNVHIFENTSLLSFDPFYDYVEITTNNYYKIKASSLIITTSIDKIDISSIPSVEIYKRYGIKLKTNFKEEKAIKVLNDIPVYIRVDNFGNMIVSGADSKYNYRMESQKYIDMQEKENERRLKSLVDKLFPNIKYSDEILSFSGNIITTKDKFPIISEIDKIPNVYLNVGVGSSSIENILIGADILKEAIRGYYKKEASLFKINR